MLLKIAQVMEDNLEYLATLKPSITENQSANLVLLIFLFVSLSLFCRVIRADEGSISEHDKDTVSIVLHEPLGVVGKSFHGISQC
jgi:aldehyde dehydrogenase (NAD+)/aldehyde dehydrogenase